MITILVILAAIVFCLWFFQNQIVGHIAENTSKLQKIGILKRIGSDKTGYWEIHDEQNPN